MAAAKKEGCKHGECYAAACLPNQHPQHGRHCWIAGHGQLHMNGHMSNELQEVGQNIFSAEYCLKRSNYDNTMVDTTVEFCAGVPGMGAENWYYKSTFVQYLFSTAYFRP